MTNVYFFLFVTFLRSKSPPGLTDSTRAELTGHYKKKTKKTKRFCGHVEKFLLAIPQQITANFDWDANAPG